MKFSSASGYGVYTNPAASDPWGSPPNPLQIEETVESGSTLRFAGVAVFYLVVQVVATNLRTLIRGVWGS